MRVLSTICFGLAVSVVGWGTAAQSPTAFNNRNAAELFGLDHVPKFEFTLPDDQWQSLQSHATDEQDARAEARFDGQPAGVIGLRFKGGVGSLTQCVDKTGALKCAKLSFQLGFEKYDAGNRFFGLKRLNLNSMIGDPTKLHERLAFDLFEQSGIKAPRSAWATAFVNGKSYGLFSMVEQVDDHFTADRWPGNGNGNGNLYKEVWPQTTAPADYVQALVTNKDTPKNDAIVAFAGDLASGDAAHLSAALGKWTDPAYMAKYMAVDDAVANCDGITAMYAANATSPGSHNHNFFWYQEPNRNVFWLIPWDVDLTFNKCETFAAVPRWNSLPADCHRTYPVWGGSYVHAPGCDRLFQAIAARRTDYEAAVDQLLSGPFAAQTIVDKIDRWSKFIHDAEVADPTAGGEGPWTSAVQELKNTVPALRERLQALRNGRPGL
jgi:spore coat protein H